MAKYDFDFKKKVVLAYLKGKCHERPENQTAKAWLNENGIDVKQYYYWQRRLRILAAETTNKSLPKTRSSEEVTFVEMPSLNELPAERTEEKVSSSGPAALILVGKIEIELHNGISDECLWMISSSGQNNVLPTVSLQKEKPLMV